MYDADLNNRESGGHVVITLRGELDITNAADAEDLMVAAVRLQSWVIVDMASLEFIDCSCLRALMRLLVQARRSGGGVLLAAPQDPVRRILTLTDQIDIFTVCGSVEEAAARIAAGRSPARHEALSEVS